MTEFEQLEQTFEEWSEKWNKIFDMCEEGRLPFLVLKQHTLTYKRKWNRGK